MNSELKGIKVSSIQKRFNGNFLNQTKENAERKIFIPSFTRLGMELNGVFLKEKILSVACWGKQENEFLKQFESKKREEILKKIFEQDPPVFLLSKNFQDYELIVEANKKFNENKSAIIKLNYTTVEIFSLIGTWISKTFSKWVTIHGTVLSIYGAGVLITGEPGVGKSETASELIKMNHLFLGDDAINITRFGNVIIAKANPFSEGFIHIRGLGILNVKEMYGGMKIIDETKIHVVIELKNPETAKENGEFENIGQNIKYKNLLGIDIPMYVIPVTTGRKISELIELAVIDMKLKKVGYNAAKEIDKKYKKLISYKED